MIHNHLWTSFPRCNRSRKWCQLFRTLSKGWEYCIRWSQSLRMPSIPYPRLSILAHQCQHCQRQYRLKRQSQHQSQRLSSQILGNWKLCWRKHKHSSSQQLNLNQLLRKILLTDYLVAIREASLVSLALSVEDPTPVQLMPHLIHLTLQDPSRHQHSLQQLQLQ